MAIRILNCDVMEGLRQLADESVHCVVTSPPYWGLRDYGIPGQIGLEPTPQAFVKRLVEVFREIKRVLRADGTLWLNLGDSYNATGSVGRGSIAPGLKPKDLVGIPWRVALALQSDGWYLRSDIIWAKSNPMPESVTDRPTKSHEYVFLLTKSTKYFYDAEAIREEATSFGRQHASTIQPPKVQAMKAAGIHGEGGSLSTNYERENRNKRSVWTIATASFSEAHFACVDERTECLTATGWKRHEDMQQGMLAAQFDLANQTLSWGPVEDVARYAVEDQSMVVGSCRDMSMLLTPNHRTIVQRRHPRTRQHQAPVVIRADELKASHAIPTAADWSFDGDASIPIEWAELLGWYVAEGHESKDSLSVEMYQSESANSSKCRRIEQLLRQVGAEWTKATCTRLWRGRETEQSAYRIMGYAAVRLREMAPGKRVPWGVVLWSHDRVAALVDGLIGGDGHTRMDGRKSFIQKDMDQCGLMQALALRLGYSATLTRHPGGAGVVYVTTHRTRSFRGTNGKGSPPVVRKYTGTVWCPKLPHGTWVARRNGKVFITGNTFPPELPELCIKAGTSAKGCCAVCGKPWERQQERIGPDGVGVIVNASNRHAKKADGAPLMGNNAYCAPTDLERGSFHAKNGVAQRRDAGWVPSCECAADVVPCVVLDPFSGAGTTALVADRLQRDAIGIELNPEYSALSSRRLDDDRGGLLDIMEAR